MSLDAYNQQLHLEIAPNGSASKILLGDTDVSKHFHAIEVSVRVGSLTSVVLEGHFIDRGKDPQPILIEGMLIPIEDAQAYLAWKREQLRA